MRVLHHAGREAARVFVRSLCERLESCEHMGVGIHAPHAECKGVEFLQIVRYEVIADEANLPRLRLQPCEDALEVAQLVDAHEVRADISRVVRRDDRVKIRIKIFLPRRLEQVTVAVRSRYDDVRALRVQAVDGLHAGGDVRLDEVFGTHGVRGIGEPLARDAVPGLHRLPLRQDDPNPDRPLRLDLRREEEVCIGEEHDERGGEDEVRQRLFPVLFPIHGNPSPRLRECGDRLSRAACRTAAS